MRDLVIESMQKDEYQENKIEAILDKIRDEEYQKGLSIDETILINKINKSKRDIEYDLTTGDRKITSSTFDDINWLIQAR